MTRAHKIYIRTKKEDSAFVYNVLEANEGLASYSTGPFKNQDPYRDLILTMSQETVAEVHELLDELGDLVSILEEEAPKS